MFRALLNLLFPRRCFSCGNPVKNSYPYRLVCPSCVQTIRLIEDSGDSVCPKCSAFLYSAPVDTCRQCRVSRYFFEKNISLFSYTDPILKELVHEMKFRRNKDAAGDITVLVHPPLRRVLDRIQPDLIVPVPLSPDARKKRGFNQVELILSSCDVPFVPVLARQPHSQRQSLLPASLRREYVRQQFDMVSSLKNTVRNKKILLIDDIFTTGSTVSECSRVLSENGANSVTVVTFFRA